MARVGAGAEGRSCPFSTTSAVRRLRLLSPFSALRRAERTALPGCGMKAAEMLWPPWEPSQPEAIATPQLPSRPAPLPAESERASDQPKDTEGGGAVRKRSRSIAPSLPLCVCVLHPFLPLAERRCEVTCFLGRGEKEGGEWESPTFTRSSCLLPSCLLETPAWDPRTDTPCSSPHRTAILKNERLPTLPRVGGFCLARPLLLRPKPLRNKAPDGILTAGALLLNGGNQVAPLSMHSG